MSDYYQLDVNTLDEALEYCAGYQTLRPSIVFRGQANASWPLQANAFRKNKTDPFFLTDQLVDWWGYQDDTPVLAPEQIWQVAQEYADCGFCTDLIDFSRSPKIAAFFALGAPRSKNHNLPSRSALYIVDPVDFDRIPDLVEKADPPLPTKLATVLSRYNDLCWNNRIDKLHRLEAQQGSFVRDPNGTLEATTDGRMSILPLAYEDVFGYPPLLKKVSFTPQTRDLDMLKKSDVTYNMLFPLANQLEHLIDRFVNESKYTVYF